MKSDITLGNQTEKEVATKASEPKQTQKRSSQWILGIWGLHKYMTHLPAGKQRQIRF